MRRMNYSCKKPWCGYDVMFKIPVLESQKLHYRRCLRNTCKLVLIQLENMAGPD
ncbi:hypothetical protein Hanom_Chr03g00256331 [Helianthus anomalus]